MARLTKAVFPVAGFGTRFLPATKAMPKELLPIIDKPLIQYAVEEAVSAGITDLIFVTGRSKRAIEDHFDVNPELEMQLAATGKTELRDMVRNIVPEGVNCIFLRQPQPRGLGHAVLCAAPAVGDQPFAVLLADDMMKGDALPTPDLVAAFARKPQNLLSIAEVALSEVSKYGIVRPGQPDADGLVPVQGLIEKPAPEKAPSRLASVGRYVFEAEIFDILRGLGPGAGGEIQLADAIDILAREGRVAALTCRARRYDCGDKLGFLEAIVDHALDHPDFGVPFRAILAERLGSRVPDAAAPLRAAGS